MIELGDHDGARAVLDLGLRLDPGEPALLETQGDVLVAMGFRRAAEAAYLQALDADPERQRALLELARVRVDLGREHLAHRVPRAAPGAGRRRRRDAPALRARALVACDQPEEAYQAFIQAIEKGASDPLCLVSAASVSFDERLPDRAACRAQARAWLERASESDPQLTLAHYYPGVLREEENDLEGALEHYERAVETDPGVPALADAPGGRARRAGTGRARRPDRGPRARVRAGPRVARAPQAHRRGLQRRRR